MGRGYGQWRTSVTDINHFTSWIRDVLFGHVPIWWWFYCAGQHNHAMVVSKCVVFAFGFTYAELKLSLCSFALGQLCFPEHLGKGSLHRLMVISNKIIRIWILVTTKWRIRQPQPQTSYSLQNPWSNTENILQYQSSGPFCYRKIQYFVLPLRIVVSLNNSTQQPLALRRNSENHTGVASHNKTP